MIGVLGFWGTLQTKQVYDNDTEAQKDNFTKSHSAVKFDVNRDKFLHSQIKYQVIGDTLSKLGGFANALIFGFGLCAGSKFLEMRYKEQAKQILQQEGTNSSNWDLKETIKKIKARLSSEGLYALYD